MPLIVAASIIVNPLMKSISAAPASQGIALSSAAEPSQPSAESAEPHSLLPDLAAWDRRPRTQLIPEKSAAACPYLGGSELKPGILERSDGGGNPVAGRNSGRLVADSSTRSALCETFTIGAAAAGSNDPIVLFQVRVQADRLRSGSTRRGDERRPI